MRVVEINVDRGSDVFRPNHKRVISMYLDLVHSDRIRSVIGRVMSLPEEEIDDVLGRVMEHFVSRHSCITTVLREHFDSVSQYIEPGAVLSENRQLLIGANFTKEYSIESAALFNPSIVQHPDQSRLPAGDIRVLMSLRATGEGHISSIVFRQGVIRSDGGIDMDSPDNSPSTGKINYDHLYAKKLFLLKLIEMGCHSHEIDCIIGRLDDHFTMAELEHTVADLLALHQDCPAMKAAVRHIRHLAQANYELSFDNQVAPGDMVIFPMADSESGGMEDVRMVRFVEDDGWATYFGTYTAYDGFNILPQMFETTDFRSFRIMTLTGKCARNKGMALFPRKIGGQYMMV